MKSVFRKVTSLLLAALMVLTMLPVKAIAQEPEEIGCTHHPEHTEECGYIEAAEEVPCGHICTEECAESCIHEHNEECGYIPAVPGAECDFHCEICEADILYSEENFYFTAGKNLFDEGSGKNEIILHRDNSGKETSATVLVYDQSANYGKDYIISVNGEEISKTEGATSIYDAFRDNGEAVNALETDISVSYGEYLSENGENGEDISAADMLLAFDELNVRAAAIPVVFEKGESSVVLSIDIIDDEESEYDELFMFAVLDEKDEASQTAQQIFGISDNEEERPSVTISFSSEDKIAIEDKVATIKFKREGNLATTSVAVLLFNGAPLGYIDFAPYQKEQSVSVFEAGTYTIGDKDGNVTDFTEVTVYDPAEEETFVAEGADPILDAVPGSYAAIPNGIRASTPSWFPEWAYWWANVEMEEMFVYTENPTNQTRFFSTSKSTSENGSVSHFPGGEYYIDLNTSGDGSYIDTGTEEVKSKKTIDLTGIAYLETTGNVTGKRSSDNAYMRFFVKKYAYSSSEGKYVESDFVTYNKHAGGDGKYTFRVDIPFKTQDSGYVYVSNRDDEKWGGGAHLQIPNGVAVYKRQYVFDIDASKSPNLDYYGDISTHPSIDGKKDRILAYPYSTDTNRSYNRISIAFNADTGYPAKLIGFKFYNGQNHKTSDFISLNGASGFNFCMDFLRKYENSWAWSGDANGDGNADAVFTLIPIYEKIPVEYSVVGESAVRPALKNPNAKLYMGDYAVFEKSANSSRKLTGIYYEAYDDTSSDIKHSETVHADADGLVRIKLNNLYTRYVFKGVYDESATELSVYYQSNSSGIKGELEGGEGIKVRSENYVKNEFATLITKPQESYETVWHTSRGDYYGSVYYHQLKGDPEDNVIYVEFIKRESGNETKGNFSGNLGRSYVNLFTRSDKLSVPLSNAKISFTANESYYATSDENGNFEFAGITLNKKTRTYKAAIAYQGGFAYADIEVSPGGSADIIIPQFAVGESRPEKVMASVSGDDINANVIPLETANTVSIQVDVQDYEDSKAKKVKLYFYDTTAGRNPNEPHALMLEKTIENPFTKVGNVSYWQINIGTEEIPVNTRLFVGIETEKTIYQRDSEGNIISSETTPMTTIPADCGFEFVSEMEDSTIPVLYPLPRTPSLTDMAVEAELDKQNSTPALRSSSSDLPNLTSGNTEQEVRDRFSLPWLGNADFSLTSSTGGFFVTRTDPDTGICYLMCGYSFAGVYAKGSPADKFKAGKENYNDGKENYSAVKKKFGSSDNQVQTVDTNTNTEEEGGENKKPSNWTFAPAFMFKMAVESIDDELYINKYEIILGFDLWYYRTFPITVHGVPFYISISFMTEGVFELATKLKEKSLVLGDDVVRFLENFKSEYIETMEGIIGTSAFEFGIKGGVGVNNFLSAYITGKIVSPILVQVAPRFDIAGEFAADLGFGADLVIFSGNLTWNLATLYWGDDGYDDDNGDGVIDEYDSDILAELYTIQDKQTGNLYSARTASGMTNAEFEEAVNNLNFSVMERNRASFRKINDPKTVSENTFKNTGVHLWEFENKSIAAAYLCDNGAEGLNFLSAVYSVSDDGGKTWSEEKFFAENLSEEASSLQYDINIFELEDRILVSWSEANYDKLISEMNIDKENITPSQVAKLMGAMNLRGVFLDKYDGSVIGEPFTIAENSTVACGMLEAVQNGENVYVYYQRNAIPQKDDMTLEELLGMERTVALARASVNDSQNWESTPVRFEIEDGRQLRITEVEPFAYNGIVGEIIVVDRDGKLVKQQADGSFVPSDDDRMLFLRTYTFSEETGAPEKAVLLPLTETTGCTQHPKVVSGKNGIYLFYNEDGNLVYKENFVANESDSEEIKEHYALAIRNSDGTYSVNDPPESGAKYVASHGSINYGTKFSASIDAKDDIFLCWAADEEKDGVTFITEEIYGVMLRKTTNAKAAELSGIEIGEEDAESMRLWAVGNPVPITDENGLFGALDSICTDAEKGEFLLAYSRLNSDVRNKVTASDIKVVSGNNDPEIKIDDIGYEVYPTPGTESRIEITVRNDGFKPVFGYEATISADGKTRTADFEKTLWPGTSETFSVSLNVPEDFSKDTEVTVKINGKDEQRIFSDTKTFTAKYGPYFTVDDVWQTSIPGTKNDEIKVTVRNIGNCAGIPEIEVLNSIFGTEDEPKEYSFKGTEEVAPGSSAEVIYVLEETYINEEQTAQILVRTGEFDDQFIQEFMPKPAIVVAPEGEETTVYPGSTHKHDWSDWETLNGVRSRKCASCGIIERVYDYPERNDNEENPETGAVIIVFEKCTVNYIEEASSSGKKRCG